ncbi:neuroglobin-like [Stylophora pistillata]|uniref:Neuroglobin n=1 Tax=Stylophora pistillata TaxID=50429 RepID=A0A2B4SD45_STYPI|nr:neuroglobin-like [Stylophora pistillata]XP_022788305.1 neuroglobin-like [Stylophora pistillata]PFX27019.1 Neuroglobin [Stylophora pistillata]
MGCSASFHNRGATKNWSPISVSLGFKGLSTPLSRKTKNTLKESWKLVEPVKTEAGKAMFMRLFETHPNIQDTFPTFKGVSLDELMNSRSLYLHAKRVMAAVENTINALDDCEVLLESLSSLGQRHKVWFVREEHFKVVGEALLWTLQNMLEAKCTNEVTLAWTELYNFITKTMLRGISSNNIDK